MTKPHVTDYTNKCFHHFHTGVILPGTTPHESGLTQMIMMGKSIPH